LNVPRFFPDFAQRPFSHHLVGTVQRKRAPHSQLRLGKPALVCKHLREVVQRRIGLRMKIRGATPTSAATNRATRCDAFTGKLKLAD
jgi:hypothetical protein